MNWRAVWTILLVAAVLVGGWMTYINSRYHVFSVSTMSGYHLVQHTGYYFEDVPDEYAVIRDIYLDFRDARITERGTQGNTIWDAIPAIMDATGLSFYDLSGVLSKISRAADSDSSLAISGQGAARLVAVLASPGLLGCHCDKICCIGKRPECDDISSPPGFVHGNLVFVAASAGALFSSG